MGTAKSRGRIWFGATASSTQGTTAILRANEYLTRFGNMLDSAGGTVLTRTSDTGQYTPGSYSSGTTYGYFIYAWNSFGSTVYVKFQFNRGASSSLPPSVDVYFGSGTDGSGNLTGTVVSYLKCVSIDCATTSGGVVSGTNEKYEFDFFASVSEYGVYFSNEGNNRYETTSNDLYGNGILFSRLMLADESAIDTSRVMFQSYCEYRSGLASGNSTRVLHSIFNTSTWSKTLDNTYNSTPNTYTLPSTTSVLRQSAGIYSIPMNDAAPTNMTSGSIPSKKVYVPETDGLRLCPGTIAVPFTGRNELITVDGVSYLRTTLFWTGSDQSAAAIGRVGYSGATNACLAYRWG